MNSIEESICIASRLEEEHPQNNIFKAILEYEERCESDEEIEGSSEQTETMYKGF